jgi:hydrogenase expression/formation protein HypC
MCLGIPAKVVEIVDAEGSIAKAEVGGVRRNVSIELLRESDGSAGVGIGDWILVHVGFALSKIDPEEAAATHRWLEGTGDGHAEELDAFGRSRGA